MPSSAVLRLLTLVATSAGIVTGCGFPGAPAHSSVTFSTDVLRVGTEASYACERGFELLGPSRRICQTNGTWAPDSIPFCVINVAFGKAPMQSSTAQGGLPQKAVDGSTAALFDPQTCSLTQPEVKPLWYVNLLEPYMVQLVRLDFGRPCCAKNQPALLVVRVGNNRPDLETNPICNRYSGSVEEGRPLFLPCNPPMPGAFVSVHLEGPSAQRLSICEAFVYTDQALPAERCPQFRDLAPGSIATYNGRCYSFYSRQPRSFAQAQEFCESRGGTLIAETSPALQGFLSWELWRRHKTEPTGQYWLGAVRDPRRPSTWRWLQGDTVSVSFWATVGGAGDCAKMDATKDWLWAPSDCGRRINYVCQHEPLTCGRPEQPPNSTLSAVEFGVGARIVYRCQPGHLLVGPEQRQCLPTGFYSAYPPTCKLLQCGLPADIEGGHYRLENGSRSYLSSVEYRCSAGYTLVGRSALICDVDERWNGPPPRCQPVSCGSPPAILNGAYRSLTNSSVVGALFEYYCLDDRFTLVGARLLRCGSDATYDQPPPICRVTDRATTSEDDTTFDFSFLDEALAASASEIVDVGTVDLTGLQTRDDFIGSRGDDAIQLTEGDLDSEVAAAHLAAITDLSFQFAPTEGSTVLHLSIDHRLPYQPQTDDHNATSPGVHRLGRPLGQDRPIRRHNHPGITWPKPLETTAAAPLEATVAPPLETTVTPSPYSPAASRPTRGRLPYGRNGLKPGLTRDFDRASQAGSRHQPVTGQPAIPVGHVPLTHPSVESDQAAEDRADPSSKSQHQWTHSRQMLSPSDWAYPSHRQRYKPIVEIQSNFQTAEPDLYRFRSISMKDIAPHMPRTIRISGYQSLPVPPFGGRGPSVAVSAPPRRRASSQTPPRRRSDTVPLLTPRPPAEDTTGLRTGRRPDTIGLPARRHPDTTGLPTRRHPDTTGLQTGRHPDITGLPTRRNPDTTGIQTGRHPDTTDLQTRRHSDATGLQTTRRHPDTTGPQTRRHPDIKGLQTTRRHPDTTGLQTRRHSDATGLQTTRGHPDTTGLPTRRHPDTTGPQTGRHPDTTGLQTTRRHPDTTGLPTRRHPDTTVADTETSYPSTLIPPQFWPGVTEPPEPVFFSVTARSAGGTTALADRGPRRSPTRPPFSPVRLRPRPPTTPPTFTWEPERTTASPPIPHVAESPASPPVPASPPRPPFVASPPSPPVLASPPSPPVPAWSPSPPVAASPASPPVLTSPPRTPVIASPPSPPVPAPPAWSPSPPVPASPPRTSVIASPPSPPVPAPPAWSPSPPVPASPPSPPVPAWSPSPPVAASPPRPPVAASSPRPPFPASSPAPPERPTVPVPTPGDYERPEESRTPDTVNIRVHTPPGVTEARPDEKEGGSGTAPRLNLSGIVALGVFGGFVFLAAVLTTIVIIVRRSRRIPHKHVRRHYISSSYSTDSETHNLGKRPRRGWSAAAAGSQHSPHSRLSGAGYRDTGELTVADVAHVYRGDEKRRHHHHHHHHRHHHGHGGEERSRRH